MKQTFPLLLFISLLPISLKAQQENEIKINFLALLEPIAQVFYEHIWVETGFGVETALNYNWQDSEVLLASGQLPPEQEFEMKTAGLLLAARYYFQRGTRDRHFFGSVFCFNEFKMESDPEYLIIYQKIYGVPAFDPIWRRATIGVFAGYKWIVREQLVVEPLFGIGYNLLPLFDHRRRSDVLAFISANIGYRF